MALEHRGRLADDPRYCRGQEPSDRNHRFRSNPQGAIGPRASEPPPSVRPAHVDAWHRTGEALGNQAARPSECLERVAAALPVCEHAACVGFGPVAASRCGREALGHARASRAVKRAAAGESRMARELARSQLDRAHAGEHGVTFGFRSDGESRMTSRSRAQVPCPDRARAGETEWRSDFGPTVRVAWPRDLARRSPARIALAPANTE
jgi:hypothetical protein